jgi:NAD(P)-dependent dehydrogenase (short-subunit alcohol dehydrogenase family)
LPTRPKSPRNAARKLAESIYRHRPKRSENIGPLGVLVINIEADSGRKAVGKHPSSRANYSASKGGIIAFTKTLALEMAKFNITANSIAPGFTSTEMVDAIPEEIAAQIKAKIPLGRFASPEEIARAAAFLASGGDYITGHELNINGGYHM